MLDKTYRPGEVEPRRYAAWEDAGAFAAHAESVSFPYTIMMPPPNVTGSLHVGHALTFTLQDILIRYHRMQGRDALWQPGMDHAGIATQMVVERQLEEENRSRHELGREAFVARVWRWKEESGGTIVRQLRRLGASPDWRRERFTMDEGLSEAVRSVFVGLYKEGLIYRDKRLVNWDPKLHTAISDLEVEQRELNGHLWHFKYPIEGEEGRFITVATTRPETMLGDTAVAVHPEDPRYEDLVGKVAVHPITSFRMPIVADEYADPEQGSGAVKITPAHDFNDFEVGRRHGLEMLNIFDRDGRVISSEHSDFTFGHRAPDQSGVSDDGQDGVVGRPTLDWIPEAYRGLDRFEARERIVAEMARRGLLEKVEDHVHTVPHGDRSGVPIEPWLTDQWFADAKTLAQPAIEAVEEGRIVFVPKHWQNTFFEWMRNIQPWCISRQLWWGHQIPAWYGPDGEIFVEFDEDEARAAAERHYGEAVELVRDGDVLDTWFSSALWPFSTLGWPHETPELDRYYPGDVLVTGFDIIFFWVARMMMMGIHCMDEVPFRTVYIHALVRDARGQKMSKSKGNILDPLVLIDEYGADALRFTLAALAAQGRDIKLSESRIAGYRNFTTKLWNAARYCEIAEGAIPHLFGPEFNLVTVNRWIVTGVARLTLQVAEAIEAYRFNDAANALYQFTWHSYCDWYLEVTKPILQGEDEEAKTETRATLLWVLHRLLMLLHPFMPFVTEELWERLGPEDRKPLIVTDWPVYYEGLVDELAADEMDWVIRLIGQVRAVRAEMNVPPKARLPLVARDAGEATRERIEAHRDVIMGLARLDSLEFGDEVPAGSVQLVLDEATFVLPLAGVVDVDQEAGRLRRELETLDGEIGKLAGKLANEKFVSRAPAEVVEEQRLRMAETEQARAKLAEALERIAAG